MRRSRFQHLVSSLSLFFLLRFPYILHARVYFLPTHTCIFSISRSFLYTGLGKGKQTRSRNESASLSLSLSLDPTQITAKHNLHQNSSVSSSPIYWPSSLTSLPPRPRTISLPVPRRDRLHHPRKGLERAHLWMSLEMIPLSFAGGEGHRLGLVTESNEVLRSCLIRRGRRRCC